MSVQFMVDVPVFIAQDATNQADKLSKLIDSIDRVASGLEADGRMPDAMTKRVAAKRLRAALAIFGGDA